MLKLGIIGLGGITKAFHIPSIRAGGDFFIQAAADVFEDTTVAASLGIPEYYSDYLENLGPVKKKFFEDILKSESYEEFKTLNQTKSSPAE